MAKWGHTKDTALELDCQTPQAVGHTVVVTAAGKAIVTQVDDRGILDNAITEVKIATGAVTTTKIGDLAVDSGKLADSAVTTTKVTDGAIANAKLADSAVTNAKIAAAAAIDGAKLADASIPVGKYAPGSITDADISSSAAIDKSKVNTAGTWSAAEVPVAGAVTGQGALATLSSVGSSEIVSGLALVSSDAIDTSNRIDFGGSGFANKDLSKIDDDPVGSWRRVTGVDASNQIVAKSIAAQAVTPAHISTKIAVANNMVPNANLSDFGAVDGPTKGPPDGWSVTSGSWDSTHAYYSASVVNSGVYSLSFDLVLSRGTTPTVQTKEWPVVDGKTYVWGAEALHDSGTSNGNLTIYVDWLDASASLISSTGGSTLGGGTTMTFNRYQFTDTAPSGARFARIRLVGTDPTSIADMHFYVDYLWFFEESDSGTAFPTNPFSGQRYFRKDLGVAHAYDGSNWVAVTPAANAAFRAYQSTSQSFSSSSGWKKIDCDATPNYDYGSNFGYSSSYAVHGFTVPETGVYEFNYGLGKTQGSGTFLIIGLFINGSIVAYGNSVYASVGGGWRLSATTQYQCTAGQFVFFCGNTSDTISRSTENFSYCTYFAGHRVR